jgi:hypothetical protein
MAMAAARLRAAPAGAAPALPKVSQLLAAPEEAMLPAAAAPQEASLREVVSGVQPGRLLRLPLEVA